MKQQVHNEVATPRPIVTRAISASAIGALFALAAFIVAIVSGLFSYNGAGLILTRGLMAMILCYPIGTLIGLISQWVIASHIEAYAAANPVPSGFDDSQDPDTDEEVLVV